MEISKTPTLRIKGDFTDLHQEWKDQLYKLMRFYNIKELITVADISAAPVFSTNDTIKDKQERNLNSFFNELVNMAYTDELRIRVRAIEEEDTILKFHLKEPWSMSTSIRPTLPSSQDILYKFMAASANPTISKTPLCSTISQE